MKLKLLCAIEAVTFVNALGILHWRHMASQIYGKFDVQVLFKDNKKEKI